jgi:hypothetical protein
MVSSDSVCSSLIMLSKLALHWLPSLIRIDKSPSFSIEINNCEIFTLHFADGNWKRLPLSWERNDSYFLRSETFLCLFLVLDQLHRRLSDFLDPNRPFVETLIRLQLVRLEGKRDVLIIRQLLLY